MITNSGVDRTSVCYEYHDYGCKVAAGEIQDDSFFSYICAVDEGDDPITDEPDPELGYPRSWAKANPSIGITFQPKYLEEQVTAARGMPSKESLVRRLNFCQWVDALNPWIDSDRWEACQVDSVEMGSLLGRPCYLALDLSGKRDLTALDAVWELEDGSLAAKSWFWTPDDTLQERERSDRVPYSAWRDRGHLYSVPGRSIDYRHVATFIGELLAHDIKGLAFDPYRIEDFQRALDDVGIDSYIYDPDKAPDGDGIRLIKHGQGHAGGNIELDAHGNPKPRKSLWMPGSITALEDRILNGTIRIERNPVLTWCSASAVIETDAAGNKKWEKRKSTGRIDGIVALSMAVGAADAGVATITSVYETREGLLTV